MSGTHYFSATRRGGRVPPSSLIAKNPGPFVTLLPVQKCLAKSWASNRRVIAGGTAIRWIGRSKDDGKLVVPHERDALFFGNAPRRSRSTRLSYREKPGPICHGFTCTKWLA